jgi:response regulator RpfG family c-di-GMP phosphodiesterase
MNPNPMTTPSPPAAASSGAERQPTLLFVDDEPNILSALRRLFHGKGYRLLLADGGEKGLEVIASEPVDLVVSDMRMPGMDGASFLEQVRTRWPGIVRILLTGYADIGSTVAAINRGEIYRYIAKPWDDNDIVLIVRDGLAHKRLEEENARLLELTRRQNEELRELNAGLEAKVNERTAALRLALTQLKQANQNLRKSFLNTVHAFSGLIEMREGSLGGHSRRVAEQARTLARQLGMDEAAIQEVMLAGLLHDIGKIGLPDEILRKPFNALNADERSLVVRHPVTGELALMAVDALKGAAALIRHHHERFDGAGYPDGLQGLAIPLGARILAVVNDYDALQLGTLVNRPLRPAEARDFLIENSGKRYDPEVVRAFLGAVPQVAEAVVLPGMPHRPATLRPGMVLARDLVHRDGYLLLAHGFVLDAKMIEQLARLEATEGHALTIHVTQGET